MFFLVVCFRHIVCIFSEYFSTLEGFWHGTVLKMSPWTVYLLLKYRVWIETHLLFKTLYRKGHGSCIGTLAANSKESQHECVCVCVPASRSLTSASIFQPFANTSNGALVDNTAIFNTADLTKFPWPRHHSLSLSFLLFNL